ncbi:SDR family NAD(P)-dependent oxidoreductase [Actinocrispum wychmicini]|uniref:3-oxoacyl-[acyl-carrier protein] reductase n=1 Tax=Actinocrispum wychmicini TaxID=1213861 RepID=A0A4R2JVK6_9PSEU|nr:SDR family NAD(P)-dependent oxidoreductase [Actinocrispum wychmicini]TCO61109.1 3-oxoacyl-[acyl-carrier protein] reductase [Actinocrispum wychmicini]
MPWAVVTGGSRGIGAAACRALAEEGFDVAFTWHTNDAAACVTAQAIRDAARQSRCDRVDMGSLDEVAAWAGAVAEELRPQVLVVNAAETFRGALESHTPDVVRRILDVNVVALVELARHIAPALAASGAGAMVTIASMNAVRGSSNSVAYSASKAAVLGLTRSLAVELAPRVRVNAVAPGIIETDMNAEPLADPDTVAAVKRSLPLGRAGTPDEVGRLIAWLVGPAASYLTGGMIAADGGGLAVFPVS